MFHLTRPEAFGHILHQRIERFTVESGDRNRVETATQGGDFGRWYQVDLVKDQLPADLAETEVRS